VVVGRLSSGKSDDTMGERGNKEGGRGGARGGGLRGAVGGCITIQTTSSREESKSTTHPSMPQRLRCGHPHGYIFRQQPRDEILIFCFKRAKFKIVG
jgi:hypothetical protein